MKSHHGIEKEETKASRRQNRIALWILVLIAGWLFFYWFQTFVSQRQMRRHKKWLDHHAEEYFLLGEFERIQYPSVFPGEKEERFPPRVQIPIALSTNLPGREGKNLFVANPDVAVWRRVVEGLVTSNFAAVTNDWLYLVCREERDGRQSFYRIGGDMNPKLIHEVGKEEFLAMTRDAGLAMNPDTAMPVPVHAGIMDLDIGAIVERVGAPTSDGLKAEE